MASQASHKLHQLFLFKGDSWNAESVLYTFIIFYSLIDLAILAVVLEVLKYVSFQFPEHGT